MRILNFRNYLFLVIILSIYSCLDIENETAILLTFDPTPEDGAVLPAEVMAGDTLFLQRDFSFALLGALRIRSGAVLIIEPGVTVSAAGGQPPSLFVVVESGAKIFAEGTDANPIVFTAADQVPGAWGGLILAGSAPINVGNTAIAEIGDIIYGGDNVSDNSGVLRYVRVEYTGSSINSEREHNGITLYGVGNGTTLDFIEAFAGADDGIELFGGTVNLSHVVCIGNQDDQFDFAQGWTGTAEFIYISQVDDPDYIQDRGIEADNLSSDNEAMPFSNPIIRNVTLVGFPSAQNEQNNGSDAIRVREGVKGEFSNILIMDYPGNNIDVRSAVTINNLAQGTLKFTNVFSSGITLGPNVALDQGEDLDNGLVTDAINDLQNALIDTPTNGAQFDLWRGDFARLE